MLLVVEPPMLCPMCVARDVPEDSRTGFCERCDSTRATERYQAKQGAEAAQRRKSWSARTGSERTDQQRGWDAERQRLHRLRERIRPREPVGDEVDPWELGNQALLIATGLRSSIKNSGPLARLDELLELIRQLAYGPHDEPKSEPEAEPWDGATPGRHVG
jgi:hypothetical protein